MAPALLVKTTKHKNGLIHLGLVLVISSLLWACTEPKQSNSTINTSPEHSLEADTLVTNINNRNVDKLSAFGTTLYPLMVSKCGDCHGLGGVDNPQFASELAATALSEITNNDLVDFATPQNSTLVTKINGAKHFCWNNCVTDALLVIKAIINW